MGFVPKIRSLFFISAWMIFLGLYFSISLLWAGLGIFVVSGVLLAGITRDFSWLTKNPLLVPVLVLASTMTLSVILASPYPFKGALGKILLPFCLFFFAWFFSQAPKAPDALIRASLFLSPWMALISITQGLGIFQSFLPGLSRYLYKLPYLETDLYLAVGFTRHHTTFAFTLIFLFHVLLGQALFSKQQRKKVVLYLGCLASLIGILFTFSRGAWLALVLSTGFVLLVTRWKMLIWVICFFALLFGGLYVGIPGFHQRLFTLSFSANQERLELWNTCWKMFQSAPWFGQGYDSFGFRVPQFSNIISPSTPLDPHNMYLEFLATSGLFGFLAFLFFLGSVFRLIWVKLKVSPWFVAGLGILSSFCLGGFFDRYFDMPHTLIPVLFVLGICTSLVNQPFYLDGSKECR